MLVPAILYKEEIENAFAKKLYTNDYFYYYGYVYGNGLPEIRELFYRDAWICDVESDFVKKYLEKV